MKHFTELYDFFKEYSKFSLHYIENKPDNRSIKNFFAYVKDELF